MQVLVAGATGALGRQIVPRLINAGYEVAGTTTTPAKERQLREAGATPFVVDALDAASVARAVTAFQPDAIIHELTALSSLDIRQFEKSFALTNRLRVEGTDNLLAAGRTVGVRRFVAQSYAGWTQARTGSMVKTEDDPLDPKPISSMRAMVDAIRHLEAAVIGADWTEGLVVRYGGLYGPGTNLDPAGSEMHALIKKRMFPIVGGGSGYWSFTHVEDAADATVAALERGKRGIYSIVDDEPAAVHEWLPVVAAQLGAAAPWRIPRWLGSLLAGEAIATMSVEGRGASNAKAKRELGWQPRHASWRYHLVPGMATGAACDVAA